MAAKTHTIDMSAARGRVGAIRSDSGIFLALLLLATIFRLPWFFQDVINWDESIFILVGDSIAKGHLPYTVIWDNKPPLGSIFHALVILLLPDSLLAIRAGGAVLAATAAYLLFRILTGIVDRPSAFLGAALLVIAASVLITDGMAVMTEHVALVPVLAAILLATPRRKFAAHYLAIGALLATAALVRANLAFVLVASVLLLPFTRSDTPMREKLLHGSQVAAGGVAIIGIIALLYLAHGHGQLLYDSAIRVPLAHSQGGTGLGAAAAELAIHALRLEDEAPLFEPRRILSVGFWVGGLIGLVMLASSRRKWNETTAFGGICLVATLLSMFSSGYIWSHHLIQVAPFFAAGASYCFARWFSAPRSWLPGLLVAALAIGFTLTRSDGYREIHRAYAAHGSAYSGPVFDVASYLKARLHPQDSLFVTNDLLLYWLLGRPPLIPVAAFPAHLWEEKSILQPLYGPDMTTDAILSDIVSREPTWIVLPTAAARSQITADPRREFRAELLDGYVLEHTVSGRAVYRRMVFDSAFPGGID